MRHSTRSAAVCVVMTTFFPGLDLIPLYVAIAVAALGLVVLTRGRLGCRSETESAAPDHVDVVIPQLPMAARSC